MRRYDTPLIGILLFLGALNLAMVLRYRTNEERSEIFATAPRIYTYRGHDFPEVLPIPDPIPDVLMTVEESSRYLLLGEESDPEWLSLTPKSVGNSYVRLGPENRLFAVAMFHQLHCLRLLNLAFGDSSVVTDSHVEHCLNYLRQVAMCGADLTLERGDFALRDFDIDRTGATHTCRDWSVAYEAMGKNWATWSSVSPNAP